MFSENSKKFNTFSKLVKESLDQRVNKLLSNKTFIEALDLDALEEFHLPDDQKKEDPTPEELRDMLDSVDAYDDEDDGVVSVSDEDTHSELEDENFNNLYKEVFNKDPWEAHDDEDEDEDMQSSEHGIDMDADGELDESSDHIMQSLADKDINSRVKGNVVQVHKDNVSAAKNHLKKMGYNHKVVSGLNENDQGQLDEISNDLLARYKKKAGEQIQKSNKEGDYKKADKRFSGIVKATNKQFDNDAKKSMSESSYKKEGLKGDQHEIDVDDDGDIDHKDLKHLRKGKRDDDIKNEEKPCWKNYKQIGVKEKDGKKVPNCVPGGEQIEENSKVVQRRRFLGSMLGKKFNNGSLNTLNRPTPDTNIDHIKLGSDGKVHRSNLNFYKKDSYVDYYDHNTGDKRYGKVTVSDEDKVHIRDHKDNKLRKYKVTGTIRN